MTILDHLARLEKLADRKADYPSNEDQHNYYKALDPDTVRGLLAVVRAAAAAVEAHNSELDCARDYALADAEKALARLGEMGEGE